MSHKAYQSNISPLWTQGRQDMVFMKAFDGMSAIFPTIFRDEITKGDRRAKRIEALAERAQLLRPTTRRGGGRLVVAALPCLAYDTDDFIFVLKHAADKNLSIHVLDTGMIFEPCKKHDALNKAKDIFAKAKEEAQAFERGRLGGQISGEKRKADVEARAEIVRQYWPIEKYTNAGLVKLSGVSINTLKRIFGSREKAIRNKKAADRRKAKKGGLS